MPSGPGNRRLILIRNMQAGDRFRFVQNQRNVTTRVKWAGCDKPTMPMEMKVILPGTSFTRIVPVAPTYAQTGKIESFPCKDDPKQGPRFTGRPKPLEIGQPFFRVVWDTSTLAPEFRKPR